MKGFLATFAICYVGCAIFTFFFFGLIYDNLWAIWAVVSLLLAVAIETFIHYENRIDKLEQRIKELEGNEGES